MMGHDEARELASARYDGELDPARSRALEDHLASCAACARFAGGLAQVSAIAAALPVEPAPAGFAERVGAAVPAARRRRARAWRLAPALAAVLAVAVFLVMFQPLGPARLPEAGAAEALKDISTLEVRRVIMRKAALPQGGFMRTRTTEHIWFQAPGMLRVERVTTGDIRERTLLIAIPGQRYERSSERGRTSVDQWSTNVAPSLDAIPEPLSSTVAFIGKDAGPGPTIAGRPTRRFVIDEHGVRRVAFVDTERFSVLGINEHAVLGKIVFEGTAVVERKRTVSVAYNRPIDPSVFAIPQREPVDQGFEPRALGALRFAPRRLPEGAPLVSAGAGRDDRGLPAEIMLFERGAFPILVEVVPTLPYHGGFAVDVGTRSGWVSTELYGFPSLVFDLDGDHSVRVTAPLDPEGLAALAGEMYPE